MIFDVQDVFLHSMGDKVIEYLLLFYIHVVLTPDSNRSGNPI